MKKIYFIGFLLTSCFMFSQEIDLEYFSNKNNDHWNSIAFFDNDNVAYSVKNDVYIYNINTMKTTHLFNLKTDNEELNRINFKIGFYKSPEPKTLLIKIYAKNKGKSYSEFYHYDNGLNKISKNDYRQLNIEKNIFNIYDYPTPWKINLRGNYYYSFEGEVIDVLPFVGDYVLANKKTYFINDEDDEYNKYFKPFDDSLSCVDVSMDKFRIMFRGWTTKGLGYGDISGDLSGIFIFKLTYDGIITEDTGVYNIKEGDLLEDSKLLLSKDLKVKVKAIKDIQNNKYYQIEYQDGKNGWVPESVVKIGSE